MWVGFDGAAWPQSVDFVVFWKQVLDWVGDAGDEYASSPPAALDGSWHLRDGSQAPANVTPGLWPGIYQRNDGSMMAVSAPDLPPPGPVPPISSYNVHLLHRSGFAAAPLLLTAAVLALAAAALTWPRRHAALAGAP